MSGELTVSFHGFEEDFTLKYVVITARHENKWVFVRHSQRETYEVPGGHIEPGEDAVTAAKRELYEETGAVEFDIFPVCVYAVARSAGTTAGALFFADIKRFDGPGLPDFEMAERLLSETLPEPLTYPLIQPELHGYVEKWLRENAQSVCDGTP